MSRLAGPSGPASVGLRIAPVTTTGASRARMRSSTKADSSIVSVPWVTTAPWAPSVTACSMASASANRSPSVTSGLGSRRKVWASIDATLPSCGTASTSAAASSEGVTPRSPRPAMAMVPPMAKTATLGNMACASAAQPGLGPGQAAGARRVLEHDVLVGCALGARARDLQCRGPARYEAAVDRPRPGVGVVRRQA